MLLYFNKLANHCDPRERSSKDMLRCAAAGDYKEPKWREKASALHKSGYVKKNICCENFKKGVLLSRGSEKVKLDLLQKDLIPAFLYSCSRRISRLSSNSTGGKKGHEAKCVHGVTEEEENPCFSILNTVKEDFLLTLGVR